MNPLREALERLRNGRWTQGTLRETRFMPGGKVEWMCLVGALAAEYPRLDDRRIVCLESVVVEQYPIVLEEYHIESSVSRITWVNDNLIHSQAEAERVLEKAAVRYEEVFE